MKQLIFSFFLFSLLAVFQLEDAQAAILRVNGNAHINAPYSSLSAAVTAASSGDTIILEPMTNGSTYGSLTLTKSLYIVGGGYFLDQNDSTQALKSPSRISGLTLNAGSDGSIFQGLTIGNSSNLNLTINGTSQIVIERCRIDGGYANQFVGMIEIDDATSIAISSCIIRNTANNCPGISISGNSNNIIIQGNIEISNQKSLYSVSTVGGVIATNNYFEGSIEATFGSFNNNVFLDSLRSGSGNTFNNNIFEDSPTVTGNNNQFGVDMNTVFEDFDGTQGFSSDGKYQLKAGSPAIGTGVSGDDIGPFGGVSPYKLSGVPSIPSIFESEADAISTTNQLRVRIKAKTND